MTAHMPISRAKDRLVRMKEIVVRTGLHRATIYKKIQAGTFPRGVPITDKCHAWYESDLDAWVADPMGWGKPANDGGSAS